MASSLKKLSRDRLNQNMNSVNGEVLSETEDPYALMSEFSSLYSEKLKAIEENCEDPTEAKIRTLQEWVNDLTEQNFVLIKTVEELEKEALNRVNAVSSLALEAKESMHKDLVSQDAMNNLRAFDDRMSVLHEVIEENTKSLDACMKEIDALSRKLAEKSEECDKLRNQNLRLQGLRAGVQGNKEGVESKLEPSRSGRTTQNMRREMAAAEKSLQELQKEASRIKKELKEKLKKLQSPQEKSEALLGEIADHTKRLQDVRSKMTPLQDFLRDNSEVTRSVIRESQRSLVDFQTSGRFQDFHDETETIQRNPSEEKRSKQSLVAKTPRAEMLIKAVDNTHKDLKKKTEALQSPERKKNRTLPYETAVTVIRFEDLKGEIKNLPTIVVSERVEDSEGAVRTEKSLYDPSAAASSSRVLDPEGSSNIIIPLGRADRFLDESRPALQRLQKLEKELEIVKTSLNRKTVAFQSPDGRRNESLLKDAAVDAINLHDWEEELHGIEHELRERTENILTILEKNSPGPSDRLEELQNELERAQKEVKEKTDALKSSEGRIQALVYETQEAARRLSEMKNKVIKLENDLKCKEDLLSRANLEEMTRKEDMINDLKKSLEKTKADLEKKDEQFSNEKKQKEAIEEEINKMKSSGDSNLLKLKVCDLEKQLKEKKCELTELKKQNQEKGAEIKKLEAKIEKLNCDYNDLRCKHIKTEELLQKSSRREDAFKCEICRLQKELECYQLRVQNQEQRTKLLEDQLADLQSPSCFDDPSRSEEFNEQLRCLLSTIKCKDVEIEKHIEQEKQLCFQISKMEHCVKERDRQMSLMSDTMKKISCELRAKSNKLEKMEEENARNNLQTITCLRNVFEFRRKYGSS